MPRIRVEDYEDFEDDNELNIQDDEPRNLRGTKMPVRPPKQDKDWEERRKELINRRIGRERD